ncbi:MAG TPA: hypothetical protein VMJ64_01610 [Anaerolineales bacterium]|nr:hypothetical protein [Anaerolineales bacterium]
MKRAVILKRIGISMLVGIALGAIVSEFSFYLLNDGQTRPPQEVQIDIPTGTAARVARGEADAGLPANMSFVVGDTLVVRNHDTATHQLGPLLIPAGASASMKLATENGYNLLCSFEPSKYLELNVLPPLTIWTRIVGVLEIGLNVGFLIAVYAVFAMPMPKQKTEPVA